MKSSMGSSKNSMVKEGAKSYYSQANNTHKERECQPRAFSGKKKKVQNPFQHSNTARSPSTQLHTPRKCDNRTPTIIITSSNTHILIIIIMKTHHHTIISFADQLLKLCIASTAAIEPTHPHKQTKQTSKNGVAYQN